MTYAPPTVQFSVAIDGKRDEIVDVYTTLKNVPSGENFPSAIIFIDFAFQ